MKSYSATDIISLRKEKNIIYFSINDFGRLFNSLVGESEKCTRDALRLAEAVSPCFLWLDEIEKGLS